MGEIDPIRIQRLVDDIQNARTKLEQLAQLSLDEFLGDFKNTESAKHLLQISAQAAISLCQHMLARLYGRAPQEYSQCFTLFEEYGVIGQDLASRMRAMARFRNLLVHLYGEVNDAEVYQVIRRDLDDLDAFSRQTLDWLKRSGNLRG